MTVLVPAPILQDLAVVLGVAAVTTVVFQRLRQPVVLGYLLAGMIVGPHIPIPLVADLESVRTLSELGVTLLMFSLGLDFSVGRLVSLGPRAGITALLEVSFVSWLGYIATQLMGWGTRESIFAGAMVGISSTMIIAKAFAEQPIDRRLKELVYGVLVFEDLLAILMLAALTAMVSGGGLSGSSLAATGYRLGGFLVGVTVVGLVVVPRTIRLVARLRRSETLVVASIGLCFGLALLAERAGYSVALGAFLAGSLVAESGEGARVEHLIRPIRDMFAAVFFVSVGMLIDPGMALGHAGALGLLVGVVVVGKVTGVFLGAFLAGHGVRTSVQAGMSLAQIGEFSFIIAGVAAAAGAVDAPLYPLAVGVSTVTAFATPWLIRASGRSAAWVDRKLPRPLQTFVTLYESWLDRLGAARETPWSAVRREAFVMIVDAASLGAIIVVVSLYRERFAEMLRAGGATPVPFGTAVVVAGAVALALPFGIGLARTARAVGLRLAGLVLPRSEEGRLDLAAAPRRALVVTLQLAALLLVVVPLLAMTQPFLPPIPGAIALALLLGGLGVAFWRSAANLQSHVLAGSQAVIELLRRNAAAGRGGGTLPELDQILPGLGMVESIEVPAESPVAGRSLGEVNLRGLTGATVLAIRRGDHTVSIPTAQETLRPGDVLAVTGSRGAVDSARGVIRAGRLPGDEA